MGVPDRKQCCWSYL